MRATKLRLLTTVVTFAAAVSFVFITACAQKPKQDSSEGTSPVSDTDISGGGADSDSGKAMGLETVHYAYDSATLDSGAKSVLQSNAQILKDKSNLRVQVEGHTDERGGIQYNIALGERRANAAKAFLVDHGVNADRVSTISYGKEKPIDGGHDDAAWSKNRRANFRITEK